MNATPPASPALRCAIAAARQSDVRNLADIASTCARDLDVTLDVERHDHSTGPDAITLHLPVELALEQHPVWCLACRLACFCPEARVSVLVEGAASLFQRSTDERETA
jgi:hypothetical protein